MWQSWINGILGLWVIITPFVGAANTTVLVITGVVIAILGFWAAASSGSSRRVA
jgi:hypothetical protein